jgi:hypothetical protein
MNAAYTAKQKRVYEDSKNKKPMKRIEVLADGSQIEVDIEEAAK